MSKLYYVVELRQDGTKLEYDYSKEINVAKKDCDCLFAILKENNSKSNAIVENRLRNEVYRSI